MRIAMPNNNELLTNANRLAREIYSVMGFTVPETFRFDRSDNPRAIQVWKIVCLSYEHISATDLTDIEDEQRE